MSRTILHCDCNNFYASVECLLNPSIRNKPVAVCGDVENRHGIVLAKNYLAKKHDIKTGDAIWMARDKCPDIVIVPPSFDKYIYFSKQARRIYGEYTNQVESFGLDECWLDVTGSQALFGGGENIANQLRERFKEELGITISVGVSFNKIFAKLGSDMKKPDATTIVSEENFKDTAWKLPVSDLLYVGAKTAKALNSYGIRTIGDLALSDRMLITSLLGKNGAMLWNFANGLDDSPVRDVSHETQIKSVGNSTTAPRDLVTDDDVRIIMYALSESVAARLRQYNKLCGTVQISVRDKDLQYITRQCKLNFPSSNSESIFEAAFRTFKRSYCSGVPIRSIGVRACDLSDDYFCQISLDSDMIRNDKTDRIERVVDQLRSRFGHFSIQRAIMYTDKKLSQFNPKDDHVIYPESFFR